MENVISSFVAMHSKKSFKRYGIVIKANTKPETYYRLFIDFGTFNSLSNTFEDIEKLFKLMIKLTPQLLETTAHKEVKFFIEN